MMINTQGYVFRNSSKGTPRNWWLIKSRGSKKGSQIMIKSIYFPNKYVGQRIRIKIEVVDDE